MFKRKISLKIIFLFLLIISTISFAAPTKEWTRLAGSTSIDSGNDIAIDSNGNVYVVGDIAENMDGQTNIGEGDMGIIKYNSSGLKQWTRLVGSINCDSGNGIAVDSFDNVYAVGSASNDVDAQNNDGEDDILIVKYNSSGVKQWFRLLGTNSMDYAYDIDIDNNNNISLLSGKNKIVQS